MANANRNQLQQAYTLIEQDRLEEAITILQGILTVQPNNETAWWLMANALSEPAEAADALQNVLRINPNHTEAQQALQQLLSEYPELATPPQAAPLDAFDFDENLPAFDPTPPPSSAARPAPQGDFDFNLDALLASTPAGTATPLATSGPDWLATDAPSGGNDLDLDALFGGGSAFDLPATASEDADLTAIFDAGLEDAPRPKSTASLPTQAAPAPSMDDLFGGFDFGAPAPAASTPAPAPAATGALPGDDFFASLTQGAPSGAKPDAAPNIDDLFGGFDFGDPVPAASTPAPASAATGALPGDDFFASLDQPSVSAGGADDLFGGLDFTQPPATRPNDATLNLTQAGIDDLFGAPAPSRPAAQPEPDSELVIPTQSLDRAGFDDLFGESATAQPARTDEEPALAAVGAPDGDGLGSLDDLLGQYERPPEPNRDYAALPNMEGPAPNQQDIDSFFQTPVGGDFAGTPGFVNQIEEGQTPKKERGRRRREKGGAAAAAAAGFPAGPSPETMAEIAAAPPAKPARRERAPKPAPAPVVEVYDPYVLEARANRRSPVRAVLFALVVIVALMGLGLVAARLLAPDAVTQAALNVQNQLREVGFESATASVTDKNMGVRFCISNVRRDVERRVFTAMDVIANNAAPVRAELETANLQVVSCANPNRVLYAGSTTLADVIRYTETGDRRAYRQSWR